MFLESVLTISRPFVEKNNIKLDILPEDLETLKEGCVDYIGLSYYMSDTVTATASEETEELFKDVYTKKNPYIESRIGVGRLTLRDYAIA